MGVLQKRVGLVYPKHDGELKQSLDAVRLISIIGERPHRPAITLSHSISYL